MLASNIFTIIIMPLKIVFNIAFNKNDTKIDLYYLNLRDLALSRSMQVLNKTTYLRLAYLY